jgi:ArsR family transcriptional regulator, arsenate/arsenite/antimonite-responsive transcriptional repressor
MKNEQDDKALAPALLALADKTRLKILLMLESKPRTVGEIVDFFDLSQPTITRHLQHLLKAGLVIRQKQAQKVFYRLNADKIKDFCLELVGCFPCCCVTVPITQKAASKHSDRSRTPRIVVVRKKKKPMDREGVKR